MYKKLSNDEWREYINRYYASNENLTVKDYCEENNINKSQFYYHRRRIEKKAMPVFHLIKINKGVFDKKNKLNKESQRVNKCMSK